MKTKRRRISDRIYSLVGFFRCDCGKLCITKRRRLCTRYVNEEENWMRSCKDCYNKMDEHYAEMWKSIY